MPTQRDPPNPGELVRALFAAVGSGADYRDVLRFFTADAVFDASPMGMEKMRGRRATLR
jgi:hypothetical protein